MPSATVVTGVALPEHLYPHIETRINDNSVRRYKKSTDGNYKLLAVSLTPKGEDGRVITVDEGIDQYDDMFGAGSIDVYGQAHLNARYAAQTGKVTLQVLRLTAHDAKYANTHIYAHYRVVENEVANPDNGDTTTSKKMQVMFTAENSDLDDLDKLAESAPAAADINAKVGDDWTTMRFISAAYVGRGKCGNNYSIRISNNSRSDKTSGYKNYYINVFSGNQSINEKRVTLYPEAYNGADSLFIEDVMNTYYYTEKDVIKVDVNPEVLTTLYSVYQREVEPGTVLTEEEFDPIIGIDKYLEKAKNSSKLYEATQDIAIKDFEVIGDINLHTVQFNTSLGIKLNGGSDGAFDINTDPEIRRKAINERFIEAFNGEIDRNILSKYRIPLDYALDANFDTSVKLALAHFTETRKQDFRTYFDLNTNLTSLEDPVSDSQTYEGDINTWTMSIDGYYGKIKDPITKRVVKVTSTYALAAALPIHWNNSGGKHIPYAGSNYAVINAFLPNTAYPVYDNNIDQQILDKLVDAHVNYLAIDPKQNIIRATQTTRYSGEDTENPFVGGSDYVVSNLSEENNALIVLDIKKDVEKLITMYSYNFNETSEINTFNRDMSNLTSKYAAAQVRSITAEFSRTEEEAELGVLHLYIAIQNKPLIKYLQVDIDVNRLTE